MTANPEWTFEEAQRANEEERAANPEMSWFDPTLPLAQWLGLKELDQCRSSYEAGHKIALMMAIRICANHDLVMPEWVWKGYIAAYDKVVNAREKSWDSVFGSPYPKGAHLNAIRKRRELRFAVWNEIVDIRGMSPETPIDGYLFEQVGQQFNIGKTLAAEYYYEVRKLLRGY